MAQLSANQSSRGLTGRPVRQGRRRRWRWVALAALLVPLVELAVIVVIARWIGVLPTLGLLAAETALGGWLVVREVPRTWRTLRDGLGIGVVEVEGVRVTHSPTRLPAKELADGALVLVGGALLLLPGFVSDLLALVCLIPFTRPLPRRLLTALLVRRAGVVATRVRGRYEQGGQSVPGEVMEGTVLDPGSGQGPSRGPRKAP